MTSPSIFRGDYHIHLHHSPCTANEMEVPAILEEATRHGLEEIGLVNHLHPNTSLDVFRKSRQEIDAHRSRFKGKIWLGAELDLLDQEGHTTFCPDILGLVDYLTLGPGHYQLEWVKADFTVPPAEFLEREARSLIAALRSQRVDLVVHPFIYVAFPKLAPHYVGALHPGDLPETLLRELAQALLARETAVEFHCRDLIVRPEGLGGAPFVASYEKFLSKLREFGVSFVQGSDAHRLNQIGRTFAAPDWSARRLEPLSKTRRLSA